MGLDRTCSAYGPPTEPTHCLTGAPEGKRSKGRPREMWRRTVEGERQKMDFATWNEAAAAAGDRAD